MQVVEEGDRKGFKKCRCHYINYQKQYFTLDDLIIIYHIVVLTYMWMEDLVQLLFPQACDFSSVSFYTL